MAGFVFIDSGRIRPQPGTRVIKAAEYASLGPAQKVMDEARQAAAGIIREAQNAFRAEKQRGYEEGLRKAARQMAQQMTATALESQKYYHELQAQTIELVMAVVRKVLRDLEPRDLVTAQVKKALEHFKGCRKITLKAGPDTADVINRRLPAITADNPGGSIIDVKSVPEMPAGDIILESETSIVEASLEVQLAAIEEAFRSEIPDAI